MSVLSSSIPSPALLATSDNCAGGLAAGTYPYSGIGVPSVDGAMSTAPSPSSDTDPSTAVEWSVILSRTTLLTSNVTSISAPAKSTDFTLPTSLPATRTGDP